MFQTKRNERTKETYFIANYTNYHKYGHAYSRKKKTDGTCLEHIKTEGTYLHLN